MTGQDFYSKGGMKQKDRRQRESQTTLNVSITKWGERGINFQCLSLFGIFLLLHSLDSLDESCNKSVCNLHQQLFLEMLKARVDA